MKTSKTVFIEYSTFRKGQHFITVVHVEKGKRQIIGRIFKVYDKENDKYVYYAKDFMGNDVFVDTKELYALKNQFIDCGKTMAMSIPSLPNQKEHDDFPYSERIGKKSSKEKPSRDKELKQVREKSKPTEKDKETKVEKDHDDKLENEHDEKYKNEQPEKSEREQELEEVRERDNDQELNQDQEIER